MTVEFIRLLERTSYWNWFVYLMTFHYTYHFYYLSYASFRNFKTKPPVQIRWKILIYPFIRAMFQFWWIWGLEEQPIQLQSIRSLAYKQLKFNDVNLWIGYLNKNWWNNHIYLMEKPVAILIRVPDTIGSSRICRKIANRCCWTEVISYQSISICYKV